MFAALPVLACVLGGHSYEFGCLFDPITQAIESVSYGNSPFLFGLLLLMVIWGIMFYLKVSLDLGLMFTVLFVLLLSYGNYLPNWTPVIVLLPVGAILAYAAISTFPKT